MRMAYVDPYIVADRTIQVDDAIALMGDIHKPRGQLRGEGVSQMTILLHKSYLFSKSDHKWRMGVKNTQKFDHVDYG